MAKNLPKRMPVKGSFVYDIGTGERSQPATKVIKGKGDLRAQKGKNAGR
jgi:hypothetical protein